MGDNCIPLIETMTKVAPRGPPIRRNIMSDQQRYFLSLCRKFPARLSVEQVAWLLNCAPQNIRILVRAGLLKPLGDPPENGEKVFSADEILELTKSPGLTHQISNF
ncbi:MAG: hypothetical protein ABIV39_01150 [Verrucomicrobiota bacterium]